MNNTTANYTNLSQSDAEFYLAEQGNYLIPFSRYSWLQKEVERLNRRAKRIGCAPLSIAVLGQYLVKNDDEVKVQLVISSNGKAPRVEGFEFVAVIEHIEGGNLIRQSPYSTEEIPMEYRTRAPICDHCKTNRRRNDTFLLCDTLMGEFVQVGRNCLKDFTGHSNPIDMAQFELQLELDELCGLGDYEEGFGGRGETAFDLITFCAETAAHIEKHGWISRKDGGENSTATKVWMALNNRKKDFSDKNYELAEKAVEWAKEIPIDTPSDYLSNIRVVANSAIVRYTSAGLAASIVPAYNREIARQAELAQRKLSEYQGTVGKRSSWVLTVRKVLSFEGTYGYSHLHVMVDAEGNTFSWRSSSCRLEDNATYKVVGTVKAHEEYREVKQTVLSRCKCELIPADKAE